MSQYYKCGFPFIQLCWSIPPLNVVEKNLSKLNPMGQRKRKIRIREIKKSDYAINLKHKWLWASGLLKTEGHTNFRACLINKRLIINNNKFYINKNFLLVLKSKVNQVHWFLNILNSMAPSLTTVKNLSTNGQLWTYFYCAI